MGMLGHDIVIGMVLFQVYIFQDTYSLSRCPNLTSLDLSKCDDILVDRLVLVLAKSKLKKLEINDCGHLDFEFYQVMKI